MDGRRVTLEVEIEVEPTRQERQEVVGSYEPTEESPEPDDEWILEEVAMRRLDNVPGLVGQIVIEVQSGCFVSPW